MKVYIKKKIQRRTNRDIHGGLNIERYIKKKTQRDIHEETSKKRHTKRYINGKT